MNHKVRAAECNSSASMDSLCKLMKARRPNALAGPEATLGDLDEAERGRCEE